MIPVLQLQDILLAFGSIRILTSLRASADEAEDRSCCKYTRQEHVKLFLSCIDFGVLKNHLNKCRNLVDKTTQVRYNMLRRFMLTEHLCP